MHLNQFEPSSVSYFRWAALDYAYFSMWSATMFNTVTMIPMPPRMMPIHAAEQLSLSAQFLIPMH